ncbi:DUF6538 domain-containing protein [Novosphingobium sp. 17-62-19]|uniref:DUF6538 domain-containing protein n=1 Tax=Novosphingobium sp. 17-62-19 TaxID=1970406 RepID=UPI00344B8F4D
MLLGSRYRSNSSQHTEKQPKAANQQADSCAWVTEVGHNRTPDDGLTLSNRLKNRPQQWVTRLGHERSVRGLSLRGSIYQFRVRVPVDLRDAIGRSHVKRSLGTDSLALAIQLSRQVAAEIDAMFEQKRHEIGLPHDSRLILGSIASTTVISTIQPRPVQAPAPISGSTLSEVYDRYLQDPTKRRSDRTMLTHHTRGRVIEDVLGASKPIGDITCEDCRDFPGVSSRTQGRPFSSQTAWSLVFRPPFVRSIP